MQINRKTFFLKKDKTYRSIIILGFIIAFLADKQAHAQNAEINTYLPSAFQTEGWKIKAELFASQYSASNTFTGAFMKQVDKSNHLSPALIDSQFDNFNGQALLGGQQHIGGGIWFNSKKQKSKMFYYFGLEHQYLLNAGIDDDLLKVLFKGKLQKWFIFKKNRLVSSDNFLKL